MGAIFRVNIYSDLALKDELCKLKTEGYEIAVTALDADYSMFEYSFPEKCIIVIGNESNGVTKEIQDLATVKIKIPMAGKTESLNAGVAGSIIMQKIN